MDQAIQNTNLLITETALKNQQASIQGLETQIGQLAMLISERPQGSLPSNTESNTREQLNSITSQDEKGLATLELEPRQETEISKGKGEVDHNEQKTGDLTLRVGDETITLQAHNSGNTLEIEDDRLNHSTKTDNMVQPTLQEMSLKKDELNTFPNQLKVGDKVLLDAADPHIVTTKSNEEVPLMVLGIFPFDTVEISHPKFGSFKVNNTRLKPYFDEIHSRNEEYKLLEPP
ncbi:hypothetical protein GOBAR_AA18984 [Gossypium barbadense]|uniref:Uncharacterized protein n=1 Tax=Gossypium barbadense TaxID=3634 RepID=A0A2P5XEB3_GOSBA|nr:hypothetical protein GOBAR_AA18984 [Gossypium barbadense]